MKDNNNDKINFRNHEEFCKKLIEEAGKRRMHLINMDGVFDLVLDSRRPKLIFQQIASKRSPLFGTNNLGGGPKAAEEPHLNPCSGK